MAYILLCILGILKLTLTIELIKCKGNHLDNIKLLRIESFLI